MWKNLPLNADGFCCCVKCLNVLLSLCMEFLASLQSLFPLLPVLPIETPEFGHDVTGQDFNNLLHKLLRPQKVAQIFSQLENILHSSKAVYVCEKVDYEQNTKCWL